MLTDPRHSKIFFFLFWYFFFLGQSVRCNPTIGLKSRGNWIGINLTIVISTNWLLQIHGLKSQWSFLFYLWSIAAHFFFFLSTWHSNYYGLKEYNYRHLISPIHHWFEFQEENERTNRKKKMKNVKCEMPVCRTHKMFFFFAEKDE